MGVAEAMDTELNGYKPKCVVTFSMYLLGGNLGWTFCLRRRNRVKVLDRLLSEGRVNTRQKKSPFHELTVGIRVVEVI